MTLDDYEQEVERTAVYKGSPQERLSYTSIAFGGEVGEFLNLVKKYLRNPDKLDEELRQHMILELGDSLWYLTKSANEIGTTLEHVAKRNITKLQERYGLSQQRLPF